MADRSAVLKRLAKSNRRLAEIEQDREAVMRERDADLRAAREAGATWDEITAATGMARSTIARSLRRQ